ncbi:MAG: single-stranded DNA-binding protein [Clostridia bacterium]|nr:single-stranded DNA-binding protein [Clostridia bacterium]MBR7160261.1 single-stranded DNA-binding protein [Clostridia bacterium]
MNKVFLTGNLSRDPEHRQTASGVSMCTFGIAVQRRFANADGTREADFFNVTAWRNTADFCANNLTKGKKVAIVGYIQTRSYEQDGVKRYATDIIADEVEILSPRTTEDGEPVAPAKKPITELDPVEEDLPF